MIEIFLDIETIPCPRQEIRDRFAADIAPPANYKNPEAIAKWWAETGNEKKANAANLTALDGTWGETLAIGVAIGDAPAEVIIRKAGEGEFPILVHFAGYVEQECKALTATGNWNHSATWIGHNLIDFDLRFLWQRSKVCQVKLPKLPVGKPNYNSGPFAFDTMKEWAGWGNRIKQTDLELAFGIERKDDITGADVARMWEEGKVDVIENHCRQDVENLRAIYRRMTT